MRIFLAGILILFFSQCYKRNTSLQAGVLLTFDDISLTNWEKQLPLFKKYDAHVTFFVTHLERLTASQILSLNNLKNAGHAIGCHGLRHLKATDYCDKYSVQKYISEEIEPAIEILKRNGIPPSCFAFPNSASNDLIDSMLLKYFRHIRSGTGRNVDIVSTDKAFTLIEDIPKKGKLYGLSFHPKSGNDELMQQAKEAIARIRENRELLVLYAHDIRNQQDSGPKNYITVDALEEFLSYAKSSKIKFYTFDDLP